MKRTTLALSLFLICLSPAVFAHKAWVLPSQTVLAGEKPVVTFDAAVSNDLFYFNHVPLRLDNLAIIAPDGGTVEASGKATGQFRSVFDVELAQQGTYRIAVVNDGVNASWTENGKPKRWRGNMTAIASEVPKGAQELKVNQSVSRVETFVTFGSPNETALKASGKGLELVPVTHPNDLFAGEEARFRLQVDGAPVAGVEVEVVRGGTRYRNAQDEIKVKTGADGSFAVTWPEAGMYWLEASAQDDKTSVPGAAERRLNYVATLEVLPQ